MSESAKILLLIDEIERSGLSKRMLSFIECISRRVEVVLVAPCYLKASRAPRLSIPNELYAFTEQDFDAKVAEFAARLVARHNPDWILAYGCANARLVSEADRFGVPIVSFIDYLSDAPFAEGQLNRIFQNAAAIFLDKGLLSVLTEARWSLDARVYMVIADGLNGRGQMHDLPLRQKIQNWFWRETRSPTTAGKLDFVCDTLCATGHQLLQNTYTARPTRDRDYVTIESSGLFNTDIYLPDRAHQTESDPIANYLRASARSVPRDRIHAGRLLRRPCEGFHPLIYATDHSSFDDAAAEDPFAHYIREGCPPGRWKHEVIRPDSATGDGSTTTVCLHAHFHYPNLLSAFLERLAVNFTRPDLFITTTSEDRLETIKRVLFDFDMEPRSLTIHENRGRDVWPFVELLKRGDFEPYSVVGHFHGKRSPHYEAGDVWRNFLWDHLVGHEHRMLDVAVGSFAANENLGLIFPEEPSLGGWDQNLQLAMDLAARAGMAMPLPTHFEYPVGTMFWARPEALRLLMKVDLTLEMMPSEPLPADGTIVHALECLIPFFVNQAGFKYATSYVTGSTR